MKTGRRWALTCPGPCLSSLGWLRSWVEVIFHLAMSSSVRRRLSLGWCSHLGWQRENLPKTEKCFRFWELGLYPWVWLCVLHTQWPHSVVWWSRVQWSWHTPGRHIFSTYVTRRYPAPICVHSSKLDLKGKWRSCSPNSSSNSVTDAPRSLWGDEHVTQPLEFLFLLVKWHCPKVSCIWPSGPLCSPDKEEFHLSGSKESFF